MCIWNRTEVKVQHSFLYFEFEIIFNFLFHLMQNFQCEVWETRQQRLTLRFTIEFVFGAASGDSTSDSRVLGCELQSRRSSPLLRVAGRLDVARANWVCVVVVDGRGRKNLNKNLEWLTNNFWEKEKWARFYERWRQRDVVFAIAMTQLRDIFLSRSMTTVGRRGFTKYISVTD